MPPAPLTAWLVEDDEEFRQALQASLEPELRVPHTFGSVEDALAWADLHRTRPPEGGWPDVLLLDVNLPGRSGLDALGTLKARLPDTRILMLTIRDDAETIYTALGAGASGFLVKSAPATEIAAAVREAADGGMLITGPVARKVRAFFERQAASGGDYGLSERERDVLDEMGQGRSQREIAQRLFVSQSTVNTHIQHIYEKLHVHSASAAVAKALRERLIRDPGRLAAPR